jgi:hypothetical protein
MPAVRSGSGVDGVIVPMVPGRRRVHDGVRAEVVKAMGSERTSGASRCDGGRRPECSR